MAMSLGVVVWRGWPGKKQTKLTEEGCATYRLHGPHSAKEWFAQRADDFGSFTIHYGEDAADLHPNDDEVKRSVTVPIHQSREFYELAKQVLKQESQTLRTRRHIAYLGKVELSTDDEPDDPPSGCATIPEFSAPVSSPSSSVMVDVLATSGPNTRANREDARAELSARRPTRNS
jgi:hypothetical protein